MGIMVFPLLLHGNGDSSRDGDQVYGNAVGAGRFVAVVPRSWSSNFQCIQHHTHIIETRGPVHADKIYKSTLFCYWKITSG